MARAKRAKDKTPEVVIKYGWRDKPYVGPKRCVVCWGSGCEMKVEKDVTTYSTCSVCLGRGHT